jgi:hypothetical protein
LKESKQKEKKILKRSLKKAKGREPNKKEQTVLWEPHQKESTKDRWKIRKKEEKKDGNGTRRELGTVTDTEKVPL